MDLIFEPADRSRERVPILWSEAHRERLHRVAAGAITPRSPVDPMLSRALLKCADGGFTEAEAEILGLLRQSYRHGVIDNEVFNSLAEAAFTVQRFDLLAALLRDRLGFGAEFEIDVRRNGPGLHCVSWEIAASGRHRFTFDATAYENDQTRVVSLLFQWIFPLLAHYAAQPDRECGRVVLNLGDVGTVPGLAFCDSRPDRFLVPDTVFVPTKGYQLARQTFAENNVPWEARRPVAFWRGTTTGMLRTAGDWRSLERIRLCEIAAAAAQRDLMDVGVSDVVQFDQPEVVAAIRNSGLMRDFVPWQEWDRYRYHIDIDGNGNAWSAFFYRLLSGSPVLKVESARGLVQWFYDRLVPWKNYVPVAPDMSDLADKIVWLSRNPTGAAAIGRAGRELAASMSYGREIERTIPVISAAFRHSAGAVENIGPFGRDPPLQDRR